MIKKTINNDLSKISGTTNSFFTGADDTINLYTDPFVTGYAFIYWVDLPSWFEQDPDLKYYKELSQKNFRSFNGVSPLTLNTITTQSGFAGNEIAWAGDMNRDNTEFTISHKEYSGGIMRKMYQKWLTFMRDPRTGIALYPKLFNVDYGARNHSGQLLYCVTRPDVTNTSKHIIEYACFYSNVIPTNLPLDSLYNFELGSQDSPTIEISFRGSPEIGPDVDEYAQKILTDKIMNPQGDGYIPFVDSYNTNTEATKNTKWGNSVGNLGNIFKSNDEE